MSQFRASNIYIQSQTMKALRLIAKTKDVSADEIADKALQAWVASEYPKVSLLIDEQDRMEKELLKDLKPEAQ